MYEITPTSRTRHRSMLIVIGTATVIVLSSCFLLTLAAIFWGANSFQRTTTAAVRARPVAAIQPTPRPQVVVEPPPDGIDYESAVLRNVYAQVNPAVVNITTLMTHPAVDASTDLPLPDDGQDEELLPVGSGSGFVWDTAGHIVTNYHVVEGAEQVQVTFSDGTMSVAEVIGVDEDSDLAVIQIDPAGYNLTPVRSGAIEDLYVGMRVAAIGNPFGLRGTLTSGIVSAIGRSIPSRGRYSIPDSIQTDAAINPGNSGGPLLNEHGEVIGVNAQIRSEVRANSGVGFAIPISIVDRVVPSLIGRGRYEHSYMGVSGSTYSPICAGELNLAPALRGVLVGEVMRGGPADRAGLQGADRRVTTRYPGVCPSVAGGDVVTAINGQPVTSFDDVLIFMDRYTSPGDTVTLAVLRNGAEQEVRLQLSARP